MYLISCKKRKKHFIAKKAICRSSLTYLWGLKTIPRIWKDPQVKLGSIHYIPFYALFAVSREIQYKCRGGSSWPKEATGQCVLRFLKMLGTLASLKTSIRHLWMLFMKICGFPLSLAFLSFFQKTACFFTSRHRRFTHIKPIRFP